MILTVAAPWRRALAQLHGHWSAIVSTHLAFAALGFAVLSPLVGLTIRMLLALGGRSVVADQDIAWFLLSPLGIVSLVLAAALVMAIGALEYAAMMGIAAGAAHGRRVGMRAALRFAAAHAIPTLRLAVRVVARLLVLVLPLLALGAAAAWLLITEYDINYYLSTRPTEFVVALVVGGILALVAASLLAQRLVAWSLAMPLLLFGGVPVAHALEESASLTRGRRWLILGIFASWAVLGAGLGAASVSLFDLLGSWLVPRAAGRLDTLVLVLGLLICVAALGNLLITAFLNGSLAQLVVDLHDQGESRAAVIARLVPGEAPRRVRLGAGAATGIMVLAVMVATALGWWLLEESRLPDSTVIVAHRGAAGRAPENTLAAIRAAIEDGTDWVEIDVQESADGQVVVIHDSDFMKLSGVNLKVWDGTLAQIQVLDVGGWFAREFAGEAVPTLAQVLGVIRGSGSRLVIELKYYGHDELLEQRVIDAVETAGLEDEIAIMSLNHAGLAKIHRLRPAWKTGLLVATAIGNLTRIDVDFLAVSAGMATAGFIRQAHRASRRVFVWTVNDPVSMSRMMSLGVDGIITDEPALAREVLRERASMNPAERLLVNAALLFGRPLPKGRYRDESP